MLNSVSKVFQKTGVATLTIVAPGAGKYNCIKSIAGHSTATATIAICSPSTTTMIWAVGVGARVVTGGINLNFPESTEVRGVENKPVYIKCTAGTYRLSTTGIVTG